MATTRIPQYSSATLPRSTTRTRTHTLPHDPHLLTTPSTTTDPNLNYQPRSPGFLHKVITERNTLRTQNGQLKLALQKQQLIIKKLQGVIIKEVGYSHPSSSADRSFQSNTSSSSILSYQYRQDSIGNRRKRSSSRHSPIIASTRRERPIKFGSNEATLKSLIPVPHHPKSYHHQDDILEELMDPTSPPTTLKSHIRHHHQVIDDDEVTTTLNPKSFQKVLIQPPLKSPLRPRQATRPQRQSHQSHQPQQYQSQSLPTGHQNHTRFSSVSSKESQPSTNSQLSSFPPTISISSASTTTIETPTSDLHQHPPTLPEGAEEEINPVPNSTLPATSRRRRKFSLRKMPVTDLTSDQIHHHPTTTRSHLLNNPSTPDGTTNNRTGTYHSGLTRKPKSKPSYQFKRPAPLKTIETEMILPPFNNPPSPDSPSQSPPQPQPPIIHHHNAVSPLSSISSIETVASPLDLHRIQVQVLTCSTKLDTRGREMFTFRIEVTQIDPDTTEFNTESWIIEKTYLELFELNTKMRETGNYSKAMGTKFPSKSRWNTKVPTELEKGKIRLQDYLNLAVNSQRSQPRLMSDFLTTGKIRQVQIQDHQDNDDDSDNEKSATLKSGYLIKQDRDADHDKKFYFKLIEIHNRLEYYTKKDGKRVGEIQLTNSQVTQLPTDPCLAFQKYPYSFELLEPKHNGQGLHRHVMNTDTNQSCEAWVKAIEERIKLVSNPTSPTTGPPAKYDVMAEFKKLHSFQGSRSFEAQREIKFKDSKRSSGSIQSDRPVSTMVKPKLDSNKLFRRTLMWGKKKIFDLKKPKPIQAPIFGVSLRESVMASQLNDDCPLPMIVFRCIEYLDTKEAHLEEGIYRISGSTATIDALKEKFKTEGDYNILESGIAYDVNAVSGLLKFYLRELTSSVLTKELFGDFNRLSAIPDRRGRVRRAGELMTLLPFENYTLLRTLFAHLTKIAASAPINKMTLKNIGIIFSPTLGIPDVLFCLIMVDFPYIFAIDHLGRPRPRQLPLPPSDYRHQKSPSLPPPRHLLELPIQANTNRTNHLSMSFLPRSAPSHLSLMPVAQGSWVD